MDSHKETHEAFAEALGPWVEQALHQSVQRNPQPLVDVITPVIGPAIRKSISDFFDAAMQGLDRALELSLSPRGIGWRIEARRTGRPFSEVVLLRSMRFRVSRVLVYHRQLGLPLVSVSREADKLSDPAGLFAAVQDLVVETYKDFSPDSESPSIRSFQLEGEVILVEAGKDCALAAFVSGQPPAPLRVRFRDALAQFQKRYMNELRDFTGDLTPFASASALFTPHLIENVPKSEAQRRLLSPGVVLVLGTCAIAIFLGCQEFREGKRWQAFETKVRATPGYLLTRTEWKSGRFWLFGAQDEYAEPLSSLALATSVDPKLVEPQFTPYISLDPPLMAKRFLATLTPPATLSLRYDVPEQIWVVEGSTTRDWFKNNRFKLLHFFGTFRWKRAFAIVPP